MRFYTSDPHFGHANIIKFARTSFTSVEEMDSTIITNFNATVGPEDECFVLGDFCWTKHPDKYLARLHGKLHLIIGNHDHSKTRMHPRWLSTSNFLELRDVGHGLTLCHYALEVWNKSHWGSMHIHGHSHGSLPARGRRMDVGVDPLDFFPISETAVVGRLKQVELNIPDHHKRVLK